MNCYDTYREVWRRLYFYNRRYNIYDWMLGNKLSKEFLSFRNRSNFDSSEEFAIRVNTAIKFRLFRILTQRLRFVEQNRVGCKIDNFWKISKKATGQDLNNVTRYDAFKFRRNLNCYSKKCPIWRGTNRMQMIRSFRFSCPVIEMARSRK